MAAGSIAGPIGTVVGGIIGALGSIAGGALGGLLGTQPKQEPKLEVDLVGSLWKPISGELRDVGGWGDPSSTWDPETGAFRASAQTAHGASGQYDIARAYGEVQRQVAETSWGIADALGSVSESMKSQYLQSLEELGEIQIHGIHKGDWINQENIQAFADWYVGAATGKMLTAINSIDLTPLTIAADGMAADTAEELATAVAGVVSFANIGEMIEDETMKENFYEGIVGQVANALDNISLAPLARAGDGLAVKTVDELTTSLNDVFAVYDVGESIQNEEVKKAYQEWAANAIVEAFRDVDLSFLRVDFDRNSFAGIQQAYAAIQAWNQVEASIEAVIDPTTELTTQMAAAEAEFDAWIKNLKALGWQEEAVSEIEAKRSDYMRKLAFSLDAELQQFLDPVSEFETAMRQAADKFDDWVSNLRRLGYTEEEIAAIEARRAEYLQKYQAQLERDMLQNLSLRAGSLIYGSDSREYELQSLLFQQANEREQWASQFGTSHPLYQQGVAIQNAEFTETLLNQFKAMREQLLQQEKEARQKELNDRLKILGEEINAKNKEISAAHQLADKFRKLAKNLEEYRRNLWTSDNNLMGTRYQEAYSQFDDLYARAMKGDEEAFNQLTGKANEVLQLGREQLESRGEYRDAFYDIDQKLKAAQLYADREATDAEKQLAALNAQLEALQRQQDTLNAQLDALNQVNDTLSDIPYSLAEIDGAIQYLSTALNSMMGGATNAGGGVDWDRLLRDKLAQAQRVDPGGNWTMDKLLWAIHERDGMTVQQWYDLYGRNEGFVLHAAETTNNKLDQTWLKQHKAMTQNTEALQASINEQVLQSVIMSGDMSNLVYYQGQYWPQALGNMVGLNNGLSSVYTGVTGLNGGLSSIYTGVTGLNGGLSSVYTGVTGLNSPLKSIYNAIVNLGSSGSSWSGGSSGSYGGSSSGSYGGSSGGSYSGEVAASQVPDQYAQVPLGQGIYGSKYRTEAALIAAKVIHANTWEGSNRWTTASMKAEMIKTNGSVKNWYLNYGKAEGFAEGGITPSNRLYITGERGPELVTSPQQWGVLSHEASKALLERENPELPAARANPGMTADQARQIIAGLSLLAHYMEYVITYTEKTASNTDKSLDIQRMWNSDGEGIQISPDQLRELIAELKG